MKTYLQILSTLLLVFFLTNSIKAQVAVIDSLKIIPSNPVANDTVKVICFATFSTGGCPLTSSSFSVGGGRINMHASHSVGVLTVICHSTDTLKIGRLDAGKYELNYTLTANSVTYDIDIINFTVKESVGIEFKAGSGEKIEIYPNPATSNITFSTNKTFPDETRISINSISGQQLMQARFQNQKQFEMDVSTMSKGIYLVKIQRNRGIETKKLVVQ